MLEKSVDWLQLATAAAKGPYPPRRGRAYTPSMAAAIKVSTDVTRLAHASVQPERLLRSEPEFEVYELPPGFMDHFAYLLWREGRDFDRDAREIERHGFGMVFPVDLGNRRGYLILKERLLAFRSWPQEGEAQT
jgi:hypothetical protein